MLLGIWVDTHLLLWVVICWDLMVVFLLQGSETMGWVRSCHAVYLMLVLYLNRLKLLNLLLARNRISLLIQLLLLNAPLLVYFFDFTALWVNLSWYLLGDQLGRRLWLLIHIDVHWRLPFVIRSPRWLNTILNEVVFTTLRRIAILDRLSRGVNRLCCIVGWRHQLGELSWNHDAAYAATRFALGGEIGRAGIELLLANRRQVTVCCTCLLLDLIEVTGIGVMLLIEQICLSVLFLLFAQVARVGNYLLVAIVSWKTACVVVVAGDVLWGWNCILGWVLREVAFDHLDRCHLISPWWIVRLRLRSLMTHGALLRIPNSLSYVISIQIWIGSVAPIWVSAASMVLFPLENFLWLFAIGVGSLFEFLELGLGRPILPCILGQLARVAATGFTRRLRIISVFPVLYLIPVILLLLK